MSKGKGGTFTTEELLHELAKAAAKGLNGEGQTVAELAASLGWSGSRVTRLLMVAKKQGRLARSARQAEGLDGRLYPQSVYRIVPAAKH